MAAPMDWGELPASRFGHTVTMVSDSLAVLHGGAFSGHDNEYVVTNDLFSFNVTTRKWTRITQRAAHEDYKVPGARAAHACVSYSEMQMLIFGGSEGSRIRNSNGCVRSSNGVVDDGLFLLDLESESSGVWTPVPTKGPRPEARYGHSMVWHEQVYKVILFGGFDGRQEKSDVWLFDVENFDAETRTWSWEKIDIRDGPCPRTYHTSAVCPSGSAVGLMVVFGGRTSGGRTCHDLWGLKMNRAKVWSWTYAPTHAGWPHPRFQHSSAFIGEKLVVLGGRTVTDHARPVPTEVFDMDTCEWRCLPDSELDRFRHVTWDTNDLLMTHGGFSQASPSGFEEAAGKVLAINFAKRLNDWDSFVHATGDKALEADDVRDCDIKSELTVHKKPYDKRLGTLPEILEDAEGADDVEPRRTL